MGPRAVKDVVHLLSAAQTGSTDAVDAVVKQYLPLINKLAHRFGVGTDHIPDLIQTGIVGLLAAHQKFDLSKHTRFGTYAYHYVRGAMLNYLKAEFAHGGVSIYAGVVSLDAPLSENSESTNETTTLHDVVGDRLSETVIASGIDRCRMADRLRPAFNGLTSREEAVVQIVFFRNASQRQAAILLKVSEPRVSALLKTSLRKLRLYVA